MSSWVLIELKLLTLNKQGYGVFVTINKTDSKGRKTENIGGIRAILLK